MNNTVVLWICIGVVAFGLLLLVLSLADLLGHLKRLSRTAGSTSAGLRTQVAAMGTVTAPPLRGFAAARHDLQQVGQPATSHSQPASQPNTQLPALVPAPAPVRRPRHAAD